MSGPIYSVKKTVRHATCGPIVIQSESSVKVVPRKIHPDL